MKEITNNFLTKSNTELFYRKWFNENNYNAVFIVIHGMAEHSKRYEYFAKKLSDNNFCIYAPDLRGHGYTAKEEKNIGFFAENNGWFKVVKDISEFIDYVKKENPNKNIIIFGHSMGSLLIRTYLSMNYKSPDAVILSGTAGDSGFMVYAGKIISKVLSVFKGKKTSSKLLDDMSFGKFSKQIENAETQFDWLTRDKDIVKKYIEDPLCGSIFSNQFFHDLFSGIRFINKKSSIKNIDKELPILMIAGDKDPVGDNGKGVAKVYSNYINHGLQHVELKLYKNCRHEILNELDKDEIIKDILNWIKKINKND